jgi:hypothetical protein
MRPPLLAILLWSVAQVCGASEPESAPPWRDGQLVKVVANHMFAENEKKEMAGHPMFEKLKVQRLTSETEPKAGSRERWLISGTVIDTNAGFKVQETPIYIGYDDGVPILRAMSNRLGEVSFYVSPTRFVEARMDRMPNRIYIGDRAFGRFPPRDSFVRRYWLRPTE